MFLFQVEIFILVALNFNLFNAVRWWCTSTFHRPFLYQTLAFLAFSPCDDTFRHGFAQRQSGLPERWRCSGGGFITLAATFPISLLESSALGSAWGASALSTAETKSGLTTATGRRGQGTWEQRCQMPGQWQKQLHSELQEFLPGCLHSPIIQNYWDECEDDQQANHHFLG